MLERIIKFSLSNKLIVILFTGTILVFGLFALFKIPIGAVPDITNNQVQVITTSRNLSTQDVEQYLTYPVELEMANLPGVIEIRSVSKFGLSVVTIVFDDKLGTYLPRQLIAEKIKTAADKIPEGFGSPEMGPISTGLGEIYQYILDTKPGYDSAYSPMDLRTIQDWIVKRQLSGIKGVVEINTWGGFLKQYEVAVSPGRLVANDISVNTVFDALEKNNSIVGGGYIEKSDKAYFIRGEGSIGSLEDIQDIIVTYRQGIPVYIKDIAEVRFGSATRFGAITGNGEGEKVLGQVMMLKDANSKEVIEAVKSRVEEVQKSLPEGVFINPFLERSELLGRTTHTIIENLILGCLIVIFVVVLLLGNLRSGLVVASVIPLSLMFALSLMYVFGIDANLMSLGAIDFGIIIDGAVIIVEFIAFSITKDYYKIRALSKQNKQKQIDKIAFSSTTKMMNSAVFGQLIILIVFIPILSLTGVEGKMFRPMALTFSFALIGAMILCFTYIPVLSALFLKPREDKKENLSDKLMKGIRRSYVPSIKWALANKSLVLWSAGILLAASIFVFARMGGEFVPTLDEGDFVIQPVLKTGASLSKTVDITTQMEQILLDNFPEVKQVVSRIGAAEVPTDPMSMEESDVIITLKPRKEWVSAKTKDELADKFKEALSVIPGIDYEFTQPIEMRFNELITGTRADIAIKIFGDDLGILYQKGIEVKHLIDGVEGASDVIVEKIDGLPQMAVKYYRNKIARYGLNIQDVNRLIALQFAGMPAGSVFEGEKQFDLVVRLHEDHRRGIENLNDLMVQIPGGGRIPLHELAEVKYTTGPAKIARDETKRRIVIGVNVRNRDLETVAKDIQKIIDEKLTLPTGYNITYGGQFDNLRTAKKRLKIAVPIALLLIFVLLHFAFKSFIDALMVYTAIPLSAVGGILLLWIRGLPFSISAGVGFIALFGIAVLNGIVLIEYLKELKSEGVSDVYERIIKGTQQRLRPVLLTASAAALGFLPMAISQSAGAEVQRPLATVVIGGLITSTLLTMIVLPILYYIKETRSFKIRLFGNRRITMIIIFLSASSGFYVQGQEVDLQAAIQIAQENNKHLKAYELQAKMSQQLVSTAFDLNKTQVYYNYDENNIAENDLPLTIFGISQELEFPSVYILQKSINKMQYEIDLISYEREKQKLIKNVSQEFYNLVFLYKKESLYAYLDSLMQGISNAAERKYELGETNYLQSLTAQAGAKNLQLALQKVKEEKFSAQIEFNSYLQADTLYTIKPTELTQLDVMELSLEHNPGLNNLEVARTMKEKSISKEKHRFLPDMQFEYFSGTNTGANSQIYHGYEFGLSIPLWFGAQASRVKAAKIEHEIIQSQYDDYKVQLNAKYTQLDSQLKSFKEQLDYYYSHNEKLVTEIYKAANRSYSEGEIDYYQYIQSLENAIEIQLNHFENLFNYNQIVLEINYISL